MSKPATSAAPLSPAIRLYLQVVVAMGSLVLVQAMLVAARTPHPLAWLTVAGLALLSGWFRLSVKSVSATVGIDDTFSIAAALLFGPGVATLAVAAHSLVYSLRRRRPIRQTAFNAAALSLSMWYSANAFFALAGVGPLAVGHAAITPLVGPLLALTGVYFALNSGLTAIAVGLDSRQSPLQIWKQNFRWLWV
ncbi:MAG: hypothetical protein ACRD2I_12300, partial [Vicinamibacterales bacterium]